MKKQSWIILLVVVVIVAVILILNKRMNWFPPDKETTTGTILETIDKSEEISAMDVLKNVNDLEFDNIRKTFIDKKKNPYTGEYVENYDNGNIKSKINLLKGKIEGYCAFYFPNGKIREEGSYKENLKHGIWTRYDEKGNKWYQVTYTYNKRTGKWYIWDEMGNIVASDNF